jgi:hypothetical protein
MASKQYFVALQEGHWKIKFKNEYYGPYSTREAAIKAAVDAAHKAGEKGHEAKVFVQSRDKLFRTEWTYGNDPYPLKAKAAGPLKAKAARLA